MKQVGIENKSFFVRIGCEDWEREAPQEVLITVTINLKNYQRGCLTDNLADVYCNSQMIKVIEELSANGKEYNLIEFFALTIKNTIKERLKVQDEDEISVKVYKKSYQSFCIV